MAGVQPKIELTTNNGVHYSYSRIDNIDPAQLSPNRVYVAVEKVHGSNFQITIWMDDDGNYYWSCGNRNKHLDHVNAKFCSFQKALEKYTECIPAMYHLACGVYKDESKQTIPDGSLTVILYGEIYGGIFDGMDTRDGHVKVQARTSYCPHVDFCIFDIKVMNGAAGFWLNMPKIHPLIQTTGFVAAPIICIGTPAQIAESIKIAELKSLMPSINGLQPTDKSWSEGVVIRPLEPKDIGTRGTLFKWKHPLYDELATGKSKPLKGDSSGQTSPKNHHHASPPKEHHVNHDTVMDMFTLPRMESVHSKIGATNFMDKNVKSDYMRAFAEDVKKDAMMYFDNDEDEFDKFWKSASKQISVATVKVYTEFVKTQTNN
jgi:Rnl2 family RNA ligase